MRTRASFSSVFSHFHIFLLLKLHFSCDNKITFLHPTSRPWRYQRVLHAGCLSERRLSEHTRQLQMFLQGRFGVGQESMCWCVSGFSLECYYIFIPKWDSHSQMKPSSARFRVSSWARSVLPDRVRVQGLRACAAHPYHPGNVLLHGGQSLGTQLWKMSSGGHRWVDGDREEQLQAEKKDIKLSRRHPCVCPLVKTLWWSNLDRF